MQSHRTFSLMLEVNIVISAVLAALLMCGCGRKEQKVFTDTVYASGSNTYSAAEEAGEDPNSVHKEAGKAGQEYTDPVNTALSGDASRSENEDSTICVFVCGAVNREGVYELPGGSRVIDAVEAAGGYSDDADRTYVNQAEYVYDTQRVEIPTQEEGQLLREYDSSESEDGGSQSDGRIDLNTADKQDLMTLPGIGESKAERILEYRQIHGRFSSTEELMNVSGIGSGVYEKIKEYIKVGQAHERAKGQREEK